ncbi:hypothetical protein M8R20_30075 [Pseudomonas sp. R2.Fl]|nr:hypothetical protein [Pseudomonas sp. R2.Fl]
MSAELETQFERLASALAEERRAILEHDVEALVCTTREKLAALRELESRMPASASTPFEQRLRELSEANQSNGALLARRRREVNWALRHLGRSESSGAYDANGQTEVLRGSRPIAVA